MDSKAFTQEHITKVKEMIEKDFDSNIMPNLMDFVRIPNLSRLYDKDWQTNGLLEKCAHFCIDWIKKQEVKGLTVDFVKHQDLSPVIFGQIEGTEKDAGTIMFYGHYDKQPHMTGWKEGLSPIEPVIQGDKAYGRGISDDGYCIFASIWIIKTLQILGIPHPKVVFLFEGDEESGSGHLPTYVELLKDKIGNPKVMLGLDSGCLNYENLWVTNSLRGVAILNMNVKIIKEGVHSGDASGIVPDTFRIIRELLERIEDTKTGTFNKDFQVNVPSDAYKQAEQVSKSASKDLFARFPFIEGTQPTEQDGLNAYLNRGWRPQLTVTGIDGLPPCEKAGNVLRPETNIKLSLRLPPILDNEKALKMLKEKLSKDPPYGAEITFSGEASAKGWYSKPFQSYLSEALNSSSKNFYGKDALYTAEGGAIPFVNMLNVLFPEAQFVVTGILGPQSNAHGPNESLDIPYTKKFICAMVETVARINDHIKG